MSLYLKLKNLMLISALALLLVSCGGSSSSTSTSSANSKINGVAQKGPFSVGSKVIIHEIDSSGMQISEPVESIVTGKNGKFTFEPHTTISDTHYRIKVTGTFFNEITGSDSDDSIVLTAITNDQRNSSINILTQWQSQRIDRLLASGKSLKVSSEQSEKELIKLFGINNSNSLDISASSTSMDENNAMLLLFSGVLMDASSKYKITPQTIIDEIGNDFADDGQLNEKGDEWFIRLQALIKDNPKKHTKSYANVISDMLGYKITSEKYLPDLIPLASRPSAIVPPVYLASPSETLTLDGSESHDSGNIINYTWFRVDQQTQYDIQVSERFSASPTITLPNEAAVLAAPDQEIIILYALVVTDAEKLTHTATVKVIIRVPLPENNPPIAISQIDDQTVVTNEDTPVDITLEGSDPDGDEINFVINTPLILPNGLLEGIPPNLKFTPTANFNGTDHFNFQVNDSSLTSASARVNIIVLPVNDPPEADDKTVETDEDKPVTINFTGSDIEDDLLAFRIGAQTPSNGILSGAAPNLVYTPESNFFGNDSFDYIANDGTDDSLPASVNIIVNPINDTPIAIPQTVITNEDTPVNITLIGSDIEGDPLSFNLGSITVQNGSLSGMPPNLTYLPNSDFNGNDSFSFIANDGTDDSLPATVNIIVNPINAPPIAIPQTVITNEDTPVNITLIGSDIEGDPLSFNLGSITVQNGSLSGMPPNLTYLPNSDFNGNDSFSFIANDGADDSLPATVNIIVNPINDPPRAISQTVVTNEDTPIDITLTGSDVEGDPLRFNLGVTKLQNGSFNGTSPPNLTYTPNLDFNGNDLFDFTVNDGSKTSSALVNIQVLPIDDNLPPTANAGEDISTITIQTDAGPLLREVREGDTIQLNGTGNDPEDGPNVTFEWSVPSEITDLDDNTIADPIFTAPDVGSTAQIFTLSLVVRDTQGVPSMADTVDVTVNPVPPNISPIAQDLTIPFDPFKPIDIQLIGNDPDGTTLIYSIVDDVDNGNLDQTNIATGEVEYTPDSTGSVPPASDSFTYQVQDAQNALSNTATVNLILPPIAIATFNEQIPNTNIFNSSTQNTDNNVELVGGESFDYDGDIDTYFWEQTGGPTVTLISNANDPNPTFIAPIVTASTIPLPLRLTFTLTVTDDDGLSDTSEPLVIEINGQPTAVPKDVIMDPADSSISFTLSGTDPEGSTLTYNIPTSTTNGGIINIDGALPNIIYEQYFSLPDTFEFTVTDQHGFESEPATVGISAGNMQPIADPQALIPGPNPFTFNVTGSDPDFNLPLTFEIVSGSVVEGAAFSFDFTNFPEVTAENVDTPANGSFSFIVRDSLGLASEPALITVRFPL